MMYQEKNYLSLLKYWIAFVLCMWIELAGVAGFEPTVNGSEPFALPLGDTPKRSAGVSSLDRYP